MKHIRDEDGFAHRFRILLAEDNPGDVLLVRQALEEHDLLHELFIVSDGEEASRFIDQIGNINSCPDLFLLDLNLPKIDGLEILDQLRNRSKCPSIPVVVISSSDRCVEPKRLDAFSIDHYFKKPYDLDGFLELGALIRTYYVDETLSHANSPIS